MTEKNQQNRDPKERDEKGKLLPGHMIRLEHGAFSFLRNGKIPSIRGKRRIGRELSELRRRLEQVVPGSDDVRKAVLIGQVVKSQGFILLIEAYLRRFGVLDLPALSQGRLEAAGALSYVISFMNTQARAVASLGMDGQAQEVLNLGKYISEFDAAKTKEEVKERRIESPLVYPKDIVEEAKEEIVEEVKEEGPKP